MSREPSLREDSRGAVMVIALFMAVMLVGFLYYVVGVGDTIVYRERMQDAADAGAFSSAVVHARGMNIIALINMIMAAALAVLVALKVVETLIIAGMVVAAALSFVTFGASLAAIPPLKVAQRSVKAAHDTLRTPIFMILETGHRAGVVVRKAMPAAAQVRAYQMATSGEYSKPVDFGFGWPIYQELPTENGSYGLLCKKAGENVGTIAAFPFRKLGLGRVGNWIADKTGDLAARYSRWFCSGDGDPPEVDIDGGEVPVPELAISRRCRRCGASADACSPEESQRVCDEAAEAEKNAFPGEDGRCPEGSDGAGCRERMDRARTECRVGQDTNWVVQERTIERSFWKDPETEQVRHSDRELRTRRRVLETPYPCGVPGVGGAAVDPDQGDDLCGRNPDEHPGFGDTVPIGEANAITRSYTYKPILFGCAREQEGRSFQGGAATRPPNTNKKVPQRMIDGVELGGDRFQIRYIVHGDRIGGNAAKRVSYATWFWERRRPSVAVAAGGATHATTGESSGPISASGWQDMMHKLGQFSVAQAEYYWNGEPSADREEWLWSMQWRARLRRFRMSDGDGGEANRECRGNGGGGSRCGQMTGVAELMNNLVAH